MAHAAVVKYIRRPAIGRGYWGATALVALVALVAGLLPARGAWAADPKVLHIRVNKIVSHSGPDSDGKGFDAAVASADFKGGIQRT